ncbi:MAG: class I SAM-dependent methyltransferase [Prevotellaceae bacterium]|jgi:ubiquinone/menaquinone biosynthesis C-methylase UbiE|nr:class I SAM-dependent methyltransferase [Prevotellaceae bacterium]
MENYLNKKYDLKKWAQFIDELPLWSAPFGLKLLNYIDYKPNITALDIGFGTGFPLIEIAMRLGKSSIVYGIDPWIESIERAKEKINFYGISNIKIIEGTAASMPLENNSVNLITSNNCINNVDNMGKALAECLRVLKPNGQFIQTMNLDKSMFEFYDIMEKTLLELNLKTEITLMQEHIEHKRPSIDTILKIIKRDFIIKDIEYDQFEYKFVDGTAMLDHYFIQLAFMDSWTGVLPTNKVEEIFKRIEIKLNEQAKTFGAIKLSIPFVLINGIKK